MDENREFLLALFIVLVYLGGGFLLNIEINKQIDIIKESNLPDDEKKKKIKSYRKKLIKYSFYLIALVLILYYFLHSIFFKK